ncbi:hypothetical protein GALMADRAFT_461435 [Galerina marginata CBS 339.88]|uniref:DUF202 domain-containing protein n=1 Tax=Galerina marginata (strain CBS 339.88) TaxID=685588 RepID=A0A067T873_GALM3|nr:hypothetical protein GALMADRAFT_461435 [Galerina marginata CBS 339.88]
MASQNGNVAHHVEGDAQLRSPQQRDSLIRRSWHAILSPFSQSALASLPNVRRPTRHLRADNIPETETNDAQERPTVRDYHSINSLPPNVHVPKKIPTSVKVEGKVWFANERTWISWLSNSVLIAALSLGLFNASKDDIARTFAYVYAVISVCVLIYGYVLYQHRISMIRRRDPGHFDAIAGPILLSIALFFAVLANFIIRVRELQKKQIPIPGTEFIAFLFANTPFANMTATASYGLQQPL